MPSECAAVGYSEKLTKEFSFHGPFKMKPENDSGKCGNDSMGPSHTEVAGTKIPQCALLKAFRKKEKKKKSFTDRTLLSVQFGLK